MYLSYLFVIIVLIMFSLQVYLSSRQIRHIIKNYATIPKEFVNSTTLEQHQKSSKYNIDKLKLGMIANSFHVIALIILTLMGLLQTIDFWLDKNIHNEYLYALTLFAGIFLFLALFSLPFEYISQFKIEEKYGFNKMTKGLFITDTIKQGLVSAVLIFPLICAAIWIFKKPFGWFYMWLIWISFNILIMLIYPKYIAPLFNKFEALKDENLYLGIENLFTKANFKLSAILVMDGSKRSSHGNAYFTGLGNSKRIVFYDTLLKNLTPNQTIAVLAHELGHLAKKHILKGMLISFALSLVFLYLVNYAQNSLAFYNFMNVMPHISGLNSIHSNYPIVLICMIILMPVLSFFFTPIFSALSRKDEFEADAFASVHHNSDDLIAALIALYNDNASMFSNDELYTKFYFSHPPALERINRLNLLKNI